MGKKKDIECLCEYIDTLECEVESLKTIVAVRDSKIKALNNAIEKLSEHSAILDKQVLRANHYLGRKDEENNVLGLRYRDYIINRYVEL